MNQRKLTDEIVRRFDLYSSLERLNFRADWVFGNQPVEGKRILEVGCGAGGFLFWSFANGAEFCLGVEPEAAGSTSGVGAAFRGAAKALECEDKVRQFNGLIQELPKGDKQPYDIVLSYASINHIDEAACSRLRDDEQARATYIGYFREMAARLKQGGRLIIVDCGSRNFFNDIGLKAPMAREINWKIHQNPEVWMELLREAGFKTTRLDWYRYHPLRHLGRLFHNRLTTYFLQGTFLLEAFKQ